jgi:aerobic carbon-monoxide dehydrogenase large subunit
VFARAADALIAKGNRIAAIVLGADASDVAFADGRFGAPASNRSFDFLELAEAARHVSLPSDLADGLAVAADNEMHDPVFPNGAAACEIELDPDTGALALTRYAAADDVGRCINPLIVDGQTHGAIAQGLGQILMEICALDRASGQPLAGSLMDYALPRADVLPSFRTEIVEVLSPTNPLGIKAGGEGGTTPSLAAVTAALLDALRPLGVSEIPIPATPLALWRAMRRARA